MSFVWFGFIFVYVILVHFFAISGIMLLVYGEKQVDELKIENQQLRAKLIWYRAPKEL